MIIAKRDASGKYAGTLPRPRPSTPCACGNHIFCRTSRWGVALVSPEDTYLLQLGAIHLRVDGRNAYAVLKRNGKNRPLHQLVLPTRRPLEPDHENRNGLDNRRSNLRRLARGPNNRNRRATAGHGYIGVSLHKASGLWRGYVNDGGKQKSAGYYKSAKEAAAARDELAVRLGFTTASLNSEMAT